MSSNDLQLAPEKSECVVLTNKHAYRAPNLSLQGFQVSVRNAIRYLGVRIDTRLTFVDHIGSAAAGAKKAAAALRRLITNVGGPSQAKRSLLMSVVRGRLLYGATVWSESASRTQKNKNTLFQAQGCATLKVARCYRTVSNMASLVLARMTPAFLQAEGRRKFTAAKATRVVPNKRELTAETISSWPGGLRLDA
uniref:Reverse transcriptase domain-containing protein n=1 Tax=Schizaphis graminum TaxID=13262 RepID=A0A2S2PDN3_SCHGA